MRISKFYTKELLRQFGYLATWLPGNHLSLGDIGVIKQQQFNRISNLSEFDIQFDEEPDETMSTLEYVSDRGVSITSKSSGSIAPEGSSLTDVDCGVIVGFSKENAILFKLNDVEAPCIKDQNKLGKQIIELYKKGLWDKNWVVITELVKSKSGTILISNSKDSKIELKAKAELSTGSFDLANAELQFEVSFSRDLACKIVAQEGLTPLFKASKLKSRFLGGHVFTTRQFEGKGNSRTAIEQIDLLTPQVVKTDTNKVYFGEIEALQSNENETNS